MRLLNALVSTKNSWISSILLTRKMCCDRSIINIYDEFMINGEIIIRLKSVMLIFF